MAETAIVENWSEPANSVNRASQGVVVAKSGANYVNVGGLPVVTNDITFIANSGTPANGDAVMLPAGDPGMQLKICNGSGVEVAVFSGGVSQINGLAASAYVTLAPNSVNEFDCVGVVNGVPQWYCPSVGYSMTGNLPTQNVSPALTAHAGGGQAAGLLLTRTYNRFNTVATAGDSALLPATAGIGLQAYNLIVHNNGANSMNIFPASGEAINALGANAAYALAAGKTAVFFGTGSLWSASLSA